MVAVLQAEPVDRGPASLDEVRADFVRCALAMMDNGVDIVLIVPPLVDVVVQLVAEKVWWSLAYADQQPSMKQVLAMFADVRRLIGDAAHFCSDRLSAELDTILF